MENSAYWRAELRSIRDGTARVSRAVEDAIDAILYRFDILRDPAQEECDTPVRGWDEMICRGVNIDAA